MDKCDCYVTEQILWCPSSPFRMASYITKSRCLGTKEMDACSCGGDRSKCDFYSEVREKAKVKKMSNVSLIDGHIDEPKTKVMKSSDILLSLDYEHLEVSKNSSGGINVRYRGAEVKDGMFLITDLGRGKDFEEACDDYLNKIRGKKLVFDAHNEDRREVMVLG